MAVFHTHKTYEALKAGGFTESQAKSLLDALSESKEEMATKADIIALETKMDAKLSELELRMRLHHLRGGNRRLVGILAALELLPR